MDTHKATEINIRDIFADMNLEVDEIDSIIKIVCSSLKNPKYNQPEIIDVDNALFSLGGKLSNLKNSFRIMEEFFPSK